MQKTCDAAVVITRPRFHTYMVPLGYLYIPAVLKREGFHVSVVNAAAANGDEAAMIRRALEELRPKVVITGTSYKFHNNCPSPTIRSALATARIAKELDPSCSVLLVGPLNAVLAPLLLGEPAVDAVVMGEPEQVCLEAARVCLNRSPLREVRGLTIRQDGELLMTGATPYPDLQELPGPDREAVAFEGYIRDTYFARRATELLSSRGCPFNCTYCFGARTSKRNRCNSGPSFRGASPDQVAEEVALLYTKWGVRGIKFADVEFCASSQRVAGICEQLLHLGHTDLRWRAVTHAKSVGPELLRLMRRAGCTNIYYGVESGDPEVLRAMDKHVTLDEIRETFHRTWEAGIRPEASFLLGCPGESEESIERTLRFSREIRPYVATFHVFVPFPGTRLSEQLNVDAAATLDGWDVYQLNVERSFCDVPAARLAALSRKAYRQFYLRPSYLLGMLPEALDHAFLRFLWQSVKGRSEGMLIRNMLLRKRRKGRLLQEEGDSGGQRSHT